MKGYITILLVVLILASLISMDLIINGMGRDKNVVLAQEKSYYSSIEANRRIEEATTLGSEFGIMAYFAKIKLELVATGGAAIIVELPKLINLDEMEKWSDAGVTLMLTYLTNRRMGINEHGYVCTIATDKEIKDKMDDSTTSGRLITPTNTPWFKPAECFMIVHSRINLAENMTNENISLDEIGKGNLSVFDISVKLYDETTKMKMAHMYFDEENKIAHFVTFPETRDIKVISIDKPSFLDRLMGTEDMNATDFGNVLKLYNVTINETILGQIIPTK